jgi:hypothetical protein
MLCDSVKDGTIRKLHLRKIPVLRNCENWNDVRILGSVSYHTKTAQYNGVMVHLNGNIYFVKEKTWIAVQEFLRVEEGIKPLRVI